MHTSMVYARIARNDAEFDQQIPADQAIITSGLSITRTVRLGESGCLIILKVSPKFAIPRLLEKDLSVIIDTVLAQNIALFTTVFTTEEAKDNAGGRPVSIGFMVNNAGILDGPVKAFRAVEPPSFGSVFGCSCGVEEGPFKQLVDSWNAKYS